ncbi:MAG: hypothetical protein AAF787_02180 [Chloroflexota bacterium]
MPVYTTWADTARTCTCTRLTGYWTWEDFRRAHNRGLRMMDETPADVVHVIIDFSSSKAIPPNAIFHFTYYGRQLHPKTGQIIGVGVPQLLMTTARLMDLVLPDIATNVHIMPTKAEALTFLGLNSQAHS